MSDSVSTTRELKIIAGFTDGDDRTITIVNPKNNITETQIKSLTTLCQQALVGDARQATFDKFLQAYYYNKTTTKFDLETS